jgi:hypothetical protein
MISKDAARPRTASAWPQPLLVHDEAAARIVADLDEIVGKLRRRSQSGLRRTLRKLGGAFGNWVERMAPPAPESGSLERPPEIRFPFF